MNLDNYQIKQQSSSRKTINSGIVAGIWIGTIGTCFFTGEFARLLLGFDVESGIIVWVTLASGATYHLLKRH